MVQFVIKRDKSQDLFEPERIQRAIFAAARSIGGTDQLRAHHLTKKVLVELEKNFQTEIPEVERIQDYVVKVLLEEGHLKTAKAYETYRKEHTQERNRKKEELLRKIENKEAEIVNEDGTKEKFDLDAMISQVLMESSGLDKIDAEALVSEALNCLYEGITRKELGKALINAARSKIEIHPQYSLLAARLLNRTLYHKILKLAPTQSLDAQKVEASLKDAYRKGFSSYVQKGVDAALLNPELLAFDLEFLSNALMPQRDKEFHYRGLQTIVDRYLLKTGSPMETFELPQYFWMRVAMGVSLKESTDKKNREEKAVEFYHLMSEMIYIPSTPTLFNAGTTHPQLSSCFLNTVEDSLESIFKSYMDNAKLSKYAGGLGTDWTNVRSLGSHIKGTNGVSQGVIPFLKIFNDVAVAVNQGGKRKGAMCAYLEIWHGDLEEFLDAKKNTGDEKRRLHDVHTALWIPDLFMKRVDAKKDWTLFSPADVPELHDLYGKAFEAKYLEYEAKNLPSAKTFSAASLWRKIITAVFETGHPWITFKDVCNLRSPQDHCGVIHNSNLCTEITLNNSKDETAVCNIGSLNLAKFIMKGEGIEEQLLEKSVRTAIRMLDNVIDINFYPTREAENANMKHRPIGLGVMGYQDALFKLRIPFASEAHLEFADRIMEKISYYAISASSDLAAERGAYSTFAGSKWDRGIFPLDTLKLVEQERGEKVEIDDSATMDWDKLKEKVKKQGLRNSNCMAIAPTATISNIAGVYPCIEPAFRNIYVKENTDGSFIVVNQYLVEELEDLELWDPSILTLIRSNNGSIQNIEKIPPALKKKYKETFEIHTEWVLRSAAKRAKWIDQSQSVNIFVAKPNGREISDMYFLAWRLGLKTTYYLRALGSSQVTKTDEDQVTRDEKPIPTNLKVESLAKAADGMAPSPAPRTILSQPEPSTAQLKAAGAAQALEQEERKGYAGFDAKLCKIDDPDCEACQ